MFKWKPTRKEEGLFNTSIHHTKVEKKETFKKAVVFHLEELVLPSCVRDVKGLSQLLS